MWRRIKEQGPAVAVWTMAGLWTAMIWLVIPFARRLQAVLAETAGNGAFWAAAAGLGGLAGLWALAWGWRQPRQHPVRKTAGLAALGVFSVWM